MTDFRTITGANGLAAHQSGAFATPTHWCITRNGAFVCATNSEIDALIVLELLAPIWADRWDSARRHALHDMGNREAA